jgi:hypothetical protein
MVTESVACDAAMEVTVATVGKVVLGMMGRLRPKPATGDSASTIALPQVDPHGGMPLMEALAARRGQ